MVAQLRTYTINRGMMDSWLKVFDEEIRPIHDKIGMPISATFVNADRNEFIWIRNFNSADEIPEKEAAYFGLRRAQGPGRQAHQPHRQDRGQGHRERAAACGRSVG